jgi:hypothetical protein
MGGMAQIAEHLPSKHKALSTNAHTTKTEKGYKKPKWISNKQ